MTSSEPQSQALIPEIRTQIIARLMNAVARDRALHNRYCAQYGSAPSERAACFVTGKLLHAVSHRCIRSLCHLMVPSVVSDELTLDDEDIIESGT